MKKHKSFYKISKNIQVTYKILEEMMYMHMKSSKNLHRIDKKIMIAIKCRRKIYIFSKKIK